MKNKFLATLLFLLVSYISYGQSLTVSLSPQNPTLCSGAQVELKAIVNGGAAPYTYLWSTGETSTAIIATRAETYSVKVTDNNNNSVNASVIVTAVNRPAAPAVTSQQVVVCPGAPARLEVSNPIAGATYHWYDANGNALPASGSILNTAPITQNTTFFVDATVSSCTGDRTPIFVSVRENPVVQPVSVCPGGTATFTATGADSYTWYDAAGNVIQSSGATFTSGPLTSTTVFYVTGTTNGCTSPKVEARANVNPPTPVPNPGGPYIVCTSSNVTLTASGVSGALYEWFDQPTGGTPIISSPDFTTPILTTSKTYYVQATVDGCPSERAAVTVTISQPPALPTANSVALVCYNSPAQLTVSNPQSGVTYRWYTSATSTQPYRTGVSVTTEPLLANTIFYLRAEQGLCTSDPVQVPVSVKAEVVAPTVSGATVICPGATTLTATAPAGVSFKWYTSATSDVVVYNGAVFNATATSSRSYFVSVTNADSCTSVRTRVNITVNSPPPAPDGTDVSVCAGSDATLRATGAVNYNWYQNQTGGAPVGSGETFQVQAVTQNASYFVSAVDANGCESVTRKRIRILVAAKPTRPSISGGGTICEGGAVTLTASGSTGNYEWWSAEFGGTLLGTGATFNTGNLDNTEIFWVQAVNTGGCASDRRSRTVTVTPSLDPQFQYTSGTYCITSPPVIPVTFTTGTFSASNGLAINPTTGEIDPSTALPETYTITFTPSGNACNTPTTTNIVITPIPSANFSYPSSQYCNEGAVMPVFDVGASAGTFSASVPGLVFRNVTTGEINLSSSKPGSYTITNTVMTACDTVSATFDIIINGVAVSAGNNFSVRAGETRQLNGTVSPAVAVTWTSSNPADFFSDPNTLNPTYRPAATSGTTTLTLTTADPDASGPCNAKSSVITVRIISQPAPPTVANQSICYNTKPTLAATAPGGSYKWYNQAVNGTLLFTGNPFTPTNNLTADTVFYVSVTVNGFESDRTAVSVTVSAAVAEPTVAGGGTVCPGNVTLTVNETADAYEWRDINGDLKSTAKVYEPNVTQNTTFFVRIRVGNCFSPDHRVDLTINPTATVNSAPTGQVCSGTAQNYTITSANTGATFTYSRAQVNGISEDPVSGVSASQITEVLTNTTNNELVVTYVITPYLNGCAGTPRNYRVTVLPAPIIKSAATKTACNDKPLNYLVQMNPSVTSYFSWSRAAVPGITNTAVSGQASINIRESLHNITDHPIDVVYTFNYGTAKCAGAPFTLTVTVNPSITIDDSSPFTFACSGSPVGYQIRSRINGVSFRWRRLTSLPGQPAPSTITSSSIIDDVLINNETQQKFVDYYIIPELNGCDGTPIALRVILAPAIPKPRLNSNKVVCVGRAIVLNSDITGEKYIWTSTDGFSQETTEPFLSFNAPASGTFNYRVEVVRGDCSGISDYETVEVFQKPVANPGGDRNVCYDATSIPLNGQVNGGVDGGAIDGVWAVVTGTGTFSGDPNELVNTYIPTQADRDAGKVVLSLTSLDRSNCDRDVKIITITLAKLKVANAGADRTVCSQGFNLNGQVLTAVGTGRWVGGNGQFTSGPTALQGMYIPGPAEVTARVVTLTLVADGGDICDEVIDEVTFTLELPPTALADASPVRYGQTGKKITLNPIVSDENVTYQWTESPAVGSISNPNIKNPVITIADVDVTYTLVVTKESVCISEASSVLVITMPEINPPNTFTPNADGFNDRWLIPGMEAYPTAVVDIFNRAGQQVYRSVGYAKPWDGTSNGKPVPFGTYYFIINLNNEEQQKVSGYVSVMR